MIKVHHLLKTVSTADGDLDILRGIDFQIPAGSSAAIVGASGSGKSTLLGLLAGMDIATAGQIWIDGELLTDLSEDQRASLRADKVGFVFQSFQLLPSLTALENVMLPLELAGVAGAFETAERFLTEVGLEKRLGHYPTTLSGGEQQRVAIARAFAREPRILFADEPTGNLDTRTGERVVELLFKLNATARTTLVLVTHDEQLAKQCDLRFGMVAGELQPLL
jgi:putative ABC transport system ATP-binding protein